MAISLCDGLAYANRMSPTDLPQSSVTALMSDASSAHAAGKMNDARQLCERILELNPAHAEALNLIGVISCQSGDPKAGIVFIAKAAAAAPTNAGYLNNLGTGLSALDRDNDALMTYLRALELDPAHATAHNNIATIYRNLGDLRKASEHYQQAIKIRPGYAEAMSNYGNVLMDLEQFEKASDILESAIAIDPHYAFSYNNLGIVRQRQGRYGEAETQLKTSIRLAPDFADPYSNMAEVLKETGRAEEAVPFYQKSLSLTPDRASVHSNYVYALHNLDTVDAADVANAHRQWNLQQAPIPVPAVSQVHTDHRKLRIGFVSADFRQHSVSYFLEPLFANYNKQKFELHCYSAGHIEDHVTQKLRAACDHWHSIYGVSDIEACELIRADEIDILIDLSGHTMGNRLPMFALKAAPTQVSYLGYPATTGLDAMDFRLTDDWADPMGMTEELHSEKLMRIEGGFVCYQPPDTAPNIVAGPCRENGFITFGSCNNLAKITPRVIETWASILRQVPGSRLLLKGKPLGDEGVRAAYRKTFSDFGIEADRLDLRAWISGASHMSIYNHMDIALDPFPYNGTTTICETLWMGVPTIALTGNWHAARVAWSLLNMAGFPELVASDQAGYVRLAVELAADRARLEIYRNEIRQTMAASRLCDGAAFTCAFEAVIHEML